MNCPKLRDVLIILIIKYRITLNEFSYTFYFYSSVQNRNVNRFIFSDFKVDVHLKPRASSDLLSNNVESSQKNNATTTMTSSGGGKKKKRSKERARSVDNVSVQK